MSKTDYILYAILFGLLLVYMVILNNKGDSKGAKKRL